MPPEAQPHSDHSKRCERPPAGWRCSRVAGHDGPCAAEPDSSHHRIIDVDGMDVSVNCTAPLSAEDVQAISHIVRAAVRRVDRGDPPQSPGRKRRFDPLASDEEEAR